MSSNHPIRSNHLNVMLCNVSSAFYLDTLPVELDLKSGTVYVCLAM